MIGLVVTLRVEDGKAADFETEFLVLQEKVRANEPGALVYQLTRSKTEANTYKVMELYRDQAAADHHASTDYFKEQFAKFGPWLTARPEPEWLDPVG